MGAACFVLLSCSCLPYFYNIQFPIHFIWSESESLALHEVGTNLNFQKAWFVASHRDARGFYCALCMIWQRRISFPGTLSLEIWTSLCCWNIFRSRKIYMTAYCGGERKLRTPGAQRDIRLNAKEPSWWRRSAKQPRPSNTIRGRSKIISGFYTYIFRALKTMMKRPWMN